MPGYSTKVTFVSSGGKRDQPFLHRGAQMSLSSLITAVQGSVLIFDIVLEKFGCVSFVLPGNDREEKIILAGWHDGHVLKIFSHADLCAGSLTQEIFAFTSHAITLKKDPLRAITETFTPSLGPFTRSRTLTGPSLTIKGEKRVA